MTQTILTTLFAAAWTITLAMAVYFGLQKRKYQKKIEAVKKFLDSIDTGETETPQNNQQMRHKGIPIYKIALYIASIGLWTYAIIQIGWHNICYLYGNSLSVDTCELISHIFDALITIPIAAACVGFWQIRTIHYVSPSFRHVTCAFVAMALLTLLLAPFTPSMEFELGALHFDLTFEWRIIMTIFGGCWLWFLLREMETGLTRLRTSFTSLIEPILTETGYTARIQDSGKLLVANDATHFIIDHHSISQESPFEHVCLEHCFRNPRAKGLFSKGILLLIINKLSGTYPDFNVACTTEGRIHIRYNCDISTHQDLLPHLAYACDFFGKIQAEIESAITELSISNSIKRK